MTHLIVYELFATIYIFSMFHDYCENTTPGTTFNMGTNDAIFFSRFSPVSRCAPLCRNDCFLNKYYGIKMANPSDVTVYLGAHDVEMLGKNVEKVTVAAIATGTFHKYWRKEDIAILKLGRQVAYNHFIQGICLPSENEVLPDGIACVVTGWGRAEWDMPSNRLQQVEVFIYKGKIDHSNFKRGDMICAGTKMMDAGPRQGDSGSPLACMKNNTYYIQGLVSFRILDVCTDYYENVAYSGEFHITDNAIALRLF
ncbi:trypsin [Trichuris suis]|nr:trypsin [Trichuris suis]